MKKNTLIRNDSPHAVKMNEGSNVAERRVKKVAAVKEDEPKPSVSLLVKPTPEITPVPVKAPKRSAVKPRPSVRLKTAPPAPPVPAPLPIQAVKPRPSVRLKTAPPAPPAPAPLPIQAVKPRPSVRLKTAPPAPPAPAPLPIQAVKPLAAITAAPILDEAALWEQDNPVKSRLAQLRTRNALLDEQLQRLKTPFHAQGKKS
jgi:hypothetical protein